MAQKLISAVEARDYIDKKNAIKRAVIRQNNAIKDAIRSGERECIFFEYGQDFKVETAVRRTFVGELGFKEIPIGFINGQKVHGTKFIWWLVKFKSRKCVLSENKII